MDTKSKTQESAKRRGRRPKPEQEKRKQIAARLKPYNYTYVILFKKTLEPEADNSFNDMHGEASIGRAVDKMVEFMIAAGITPQSLVDELNHQGVTMQDVLKQGQVTAADLELLGIRVN